MKSIKRDCSIDLFRVLAILMVMLYHYTTRYAELYAHPSKLLFDLPWGHYGVEFFFIISGFSVFFSLDKLKKSVDFIFTRFSRLYPAYWAAVILTYTLVSLFSLPGREVSLGCALFNLTMLQFFIKWKHVDGVYWILGYQLVFYFISYWFFRFRLFKHYRKIFLFWLVLMAVIKGLEVHACIKLIGYLRVPLLLDFANLFIAGMTFNKLKGFVAIKQNAFVEHLIIALSLFLQFFVWGRESGIFVSIFILVFYLSVYCKGLFEKFNYKTISWFAGISFALYLVHQNIGFIIMRYLYSLGFKSALVIAVTFLASLLLAFLISKFVERPLSQFLRQWWSASNVREIFGRVL